MRILARFPRAGQNPPMPPAAIRVLHLNRTLDYSAAKEPGNEDDYLMVFESADLTTDDGISGPRIRRPLPDPVFKGGRSGAYNPSAPGYALEAGDYLFSQWRPEDYPSLADALEDLIRQAWWERYSLMGPWIVRIVNEDGQRAVQGLRRGNSSI